MSSLVVTKNPGFQNPSTSTRASMMAASTPMTVPMTAADFLDASSPPGWRVWGVLAGLPRLTRLPGCGYWPYCGWPG